MNVDITPYLDIIRKHAEVAYSRMRRDTIYSVEDLVSEASLLFYQKIVPNFDPSKGTEFKTFMISCIRNHFAGLIYKSFLSVEPGKIHRAIKSMPRSVRMDMDGLSTGDLRSVEINDFIENGLSKIESNYVKTAAKYGKKKARKILGITIREEELLCKKIKSKCGVL